MRKLALMAISALALSAANAAAEDVIVHAGKVLAIPGEGYLDRQTIRISDGVITGIEDGYARARDGETVINLKSRFVLPGLIDSHVHLTSENGPDARLRTLTDSDVDAALFGAENARKTLNAGFTAVQDVGGSNEAVLSLRDAVRRGRVPGPHIRASGRPVTPTGGHGDANGYSPILSAVLTGDNTCNGVADCRRAVRQAVKDGADVIKITATGGVLSNTAAGLGQQFFDDELEAIVATAHSMGRKVTAHAHGKVGVEAALRAGIDSIEHGTYLDDETIALFKENNATLVPTVIAGVTVTGWVDEEWLPAPSRAKAAIVGPLMLDMLTRARAGGVRIAFGTDTGVGAHGTGANEFPLMVQAGFTPEDAIHAATVIASEHIEMDDRIGTLEVGKFADMIALDGDPLESVEELLDVDFVMKGGVVYKDQ
ncbi:MAG: amidohydrolase family protein [Hyphomonadaceae bacterium]